MTRRHRVPWLRVVDALIVTVVWAWVGWCAVDLYRATAPPPALNPLPEDIL